MKITNPRDVDITIQVKGGHKYTVLANDSISGVPAEHAEFWKGLHPFMILSDEVGVKVEVKEDIKEVKEEVIEEIKEEKEEVKEVKETIKDKVKKVIKSKK